MELQIYKPSNFVTMNNPILISIIDKFKSVIWKERYNGYGDFELYVPVYDRQIIDLIKNNNSSFDILNFLVDLKDNDSTMIVEDIRLETSIENGDYFIVTGRSMESILERRCILSKTTVKGNLNTCIKKLLNKHAISPSDSNRKINNLEYEDSTDNYILGITISAQFTGDNLYDTIVSICDVYGLGFEIKRKYYKTGNMSDFNTFVFRLIRGKDRSYDQSENPYVIFSSDYGNIFSSNYKYSLSNQKTFALVAGEDLGIGANRRTKNVYIPNYSNNKNWRLKELFVDARDLQSELEDGTQMSDEDYMATLEERGYEKLTEHIPTDEIEGEFDPNGNFKLDRDYFLGDLVQVEYPVTGISKKSRISETILCEDSNGISYIPTIDVQE